MKRLLAFQQNDWNLLRSIRRFKVTPTAFFGKGILCKSSPQITKAKDKDQLALYNGYAIVRLYVNTVKDVPVVLSQNHTNLAKAFSIHNGDLYA